MSNEVRLRKYKHMLVISGMAVIAFGVWSIVKAAVFFLLNPISILGELYDQQTLEQIEALGMTERGLDLIFFAVIFFMLLVDLILRVYVGRCAVIEGKTVRKKRVIYIIAAILMTVFLAASLVLRAFGPFHTGGETETDVMRQMSVSAVVDLTSMLALADMSRAAIMVRRLRKELGS